LKLAPRNTDDTIVLADPHLQVEGLPVWLPAGILGEVQGLGGSGESPVMIFSK
jgi:hypothetical protein